jgi:DNA polymerase-3 subunit gamma/tau
MEQIRALQELVPDYESVLDDMATVLQQIAILQLAGAASLDENADLEVLQEFAGQMNDELVQLYYQIVITGRRDINLAPDPRVGFEMTLLRMVAFQPAGSAPVAAPQSAPVRARPATGDSGASAIAPIAPMAGAKVPPPAAADADWPTIVDSLQLKGAVRQLADNCALVSRSETEFKLELNKMSEHLLTEQLQKRFVTALQDSYGKKLRVDISVIDGSVETVASREADESALKMQAAQNSIENDPNVRDLVDTFGAEVEQESIRPVQKGKRKDNSKASGR